MTGILESPAAAAERARARLRPASVYARHAERARRAGLSDLHLVLSFDCDTAEDAEVAEAVHERLRELGVRPVYAVPGELLERAHDVYGRFAEEGCEFLNHGGREHTYFDEDLGRHASCFFYDEIGHETVRADVVAGHEIVSEVAGRVPRGFRTPHFGTFQRPADLRFLHSVLAGLGYEFSTSTVPLWGLRYGPVFDRFGLRELPVSGTASAPLQILDTWSCFAAPDRIRAPADFVREAAALAAAHAEAGPGVINVYGDPSHVAGRDEFFDAIEALRAVARPSGYREVLEAAR